MVSFCLGKRNVKQMCIGVRSSEEKSKTIFFPWNTEIKYYIILLRRTLPSLDHSGFLCAMKMMLDALENSSRVSVSEKMKNKLE